MREIERQYSRNAFARKLRRLADALERGNGFALQVAGRRVAVPRAAACAIVHERDGGAEEIEFQIAWNSAPRGRRAVRAGRVRAKRRR
ncbi:MAG: amphi-Trp domain-containing protein [Gammaproteobacteria bacterium]